MNRRVLITPKAREDLIDQYSFIAQDNPNAADRFLECAKALFTQLAEWPKLGRTHTFANSVLNDLRCMPIPRFSTYLVFYRPVEHGIEVVRILHGSRDIDEIFRESH